MTIEYKDAALIRSNKRVKASAHKTTDKEAEEFNNKLKKQSAHYANCHHELVAMLRLALRYLEHPDVLAITKNMALSGEALNTRIQETLDKTKVV